MSSIRPLNRVIRLIYSIIAGIISAITLLITFFRLLDRVTGPLYSKIARTKSIRVVLIMLVMAFFSALKAGNLGPADLVVFLPLGSRVKLGEESLLIVVAVVVAVVIAIVIAVVVAIAVLSP
jgi:hypothetical protein